MNRSPSGPILSVLLVLSAGCVGWRDTSGSSLEAQIANLAPNLNVAFAEDTPDFSAPYGVRRFSYTSRVGSWPYGDGFALWDRSTGVVLWIYLHHGDFSPHEVHWADFDGDGRKDIFFHAGFEDVSTTHVYLDRVQSSVFGGSQFAVGYTNDEVYGVVLDLDDDGIPEILIPEPYSDELDSCNQEFGNFESAQGEVQAEYRRLASRFEPFNFDFGRERSKYVSLHLFDRIEVVSLKKTSQATSQATHMHWRIRFLQNAKAKISVACRDRVEEVIEHLQRQLRK